MGNVARAPSSSGSQTHDLLHARWSCLVRRTMGPRRTILESANAFGEKTITPLAHGLGVHLEPLGGRLDCPVIFEYALDHSPASLRREWCVGMLGSNVVHGPSL